MFKLKLPLATPKGLDPMGIEEGGGTVANEGNWDVSVLEEGGNRGGGVVMVEVDTPADPPGRTDTFTDESTGGIGGGGGIIPDGTPYEVPDDEARTRVISSRANMDVQGDISRSVNLQVIESVPLILKAVQHCAEEHKNKSLFCTDHLIEETTWLDGGKE